MTKLKKITLSENSVVLSDQEMKMITGGSIFCYCKCGSYGYCASTDMDECLKGHCAGVEDCPVDECGYV